MFVFLSLIVQQICKIEFSEEFMIKKRVLNIIVFARIKSKYIKEEC